MNRNKTLYLKKKSDAPADQTIDPASDDKGSNTLTLDALHSFMNTLVPSHIENVEPQHSEKLAARVASLETMNIATHESGKSSAKSSGKVGFRFKSEPADESLSLRNLVSLREQRSSMEDSNPDSNAPICSQNKDQE